MTRLVLVPGFTQTEASWRPVMAELEPTIEAHVIAVPERPSFSETAWALADEHGPAVYCGYSMGGRLCLRLALDRPEFVSGLVLVSSTAGIQDPSARAARIATDEAWAELVEQQGVDAFLERWLAQPLFAGVPRDAAGIDERRTHRAEFLAHCLRHLGTGTMDPMWDRLSELHIPVGIIWGERDRRYGDIGQTLARAIPNSVPCEVRDSGHAIPLEQPRLLARAIESALEYMP